MLLNLSEDFIERIAGLSVYRRNNNRIIINGHIRLLGRIIPTCCRDYRRTCLKIYCLSWHYIAQNRIMYHNYYGEQISQIL